jgi:hypothetical protein
VKKLRLTLSQAMLAIGLMGLYFAYIKVTAGEFTKDYDPYRNRVFDYSENGKEPGINWVWGSFITILPPLIVAMVVLGRLNAPRLKKVKQRLREAIERYG